MAIHIIDDERAIADAVAMSLEATGRPVQLFSSADRYLSYLSSDQFVEPSLIMTDIRMNGTDGCELVRRLHRMGCGARIVMMSGFSDIPICSSHYCCFLEKPFSYHKLSDIAGHLIGCQESPDQCGCNYDLQSGCCISQAEIQR